MRFRLDPSESRLSDGVRGEPAGTSTERYARDAILAIGVAAVAYAIVRRFASESDDEASQTRDRAADAQSAGERIPIGDSGETAAETTDEPVADEETAAELTDEERSPEELEELAASDVQDEPAEPGEMAIDEELADELVDQGDAGGGNGRSADEPSGGSTDDRAAESDDE
ncbi:hypothetical protein [Halosolutus gelatinilyticus]|uniref:hypothetical protein n=1 Tax=Halosolutus gelatinilyticus TaxID=2931975 RepID=UPI001FF1F433|nr:hypothetical protein [Halosolutus gelatinilyticus]